MELVRRVHSMKAISRQVRERGLKVGLVPTMGHLHEGHLSLIRATRSLVDSVVVSIYVNPTQFGPHEDYEAYPRDLTRDADLCIAEGVDYIFAPEGTEMYPVAPGCLIDVGDIGQRYEGASRPGHFRGVATVVLKLFHVVQPTVAAFGEKDAQQLAVIQRLTRDLLLDVEIVPVPIVRAEDGLALSSRNTFLSPEQRAAAVAIPRALDAAEEALAAGSRTESEVLGAARAVLEAESLVREDYVALVDPETWLPPEDLERPTLLLLAAKLGEVRLIDNRPLAAPEKKGA